MKTITICGSMKFQKEMPAIALKLETKHKYNVLQCVYNFENEELSQKEIETLAAAHFKKIDISDAVYVVDRDGYIGSSTRAEIMYAKAKSKEVIMHSSFDL